MTTPIFPNLPGLAWSVKKSPVFSTIIQTAVSGREVRSANWSAPLWDYELSYDLLRAGAAAELQTLMAFFVERRGAYEAFLFDDPSDNAAAITVSLGDGAATQFQLFTPWFSLAEPIAEVKPSPAPVVKLDGAVQSPGSYAIAHGYLTFATPPAAGVAIDASFGFQRLVRFHDDQATFENFMTALWSAKSIKLRSVRP